MLGEYTNKKMAATSPCQLQNNTMIETRCYPSSVLCIRLWARVTPTIVYCVRTSKLKILCGLYLGTGRVLGL